MSDYPSLDEQKNFVRAYLEESNAATVGAASANTFNDDDVQKVCDEIDAFVPVSHFFWGVWALLQVELSPVKFGFAVTI